MTDRAVWLVVALLAAAPVRSGAAASAPDSLAHVIEGQRTRPNDPAVLALAERVVARRAANRRARPGHVADAWEWLGRVQLSRVEYAAADTAFQRALALRGSERRPDPRAMAAARGWLAEAQRVTKQLARAESTATAALEELARLSPPDTSGEIRVRATLGNVLAERGRGGRAVAELSRVVELASARMPIDTVQFALAVRNLGRARSTAGDPRGALADFARATELQERALGPTISELGTTCLQTSIVAASIGEAVVARRAAERALAIREQIFGPRHPVVAIALSTLGAALRLLGDHEGAIPLYERAVEIQRAAARPSPFDFAIALNNLGNAYLVTGDGERALARLYEARDVRERAFGPGAGTGLWSRARVAEGLLLVGRPDSAYAEVDRGLAAIGPESRSGPSLDLGDLLSVKGRAAWALGRREEAIALLGDAAARKEQVAGPTSPWTLETYALRALARTVAGDRRGALDDARHIESGSRDVLAQTARSLAEQEAVQFERHRASGLDVWLELATDSLGLDAAARAELADAVVRARLLVLDQLAEERRALPREASALTEPLRELEAARTTLASAMVGALRQARAPDSTATAALARREAAERALAARSERFAVNLRRSRSGYADVVAALPPGSALVSFVRHESPAALLANSRTPASARYSALVSRAGVSAPEVVPLAPAERVDAAVSRWLEACAMPPPAGAALARAAERRCDALGRAASALVWAPLAPKLAGAGRVFVVPDGVLHAVNFLALPGPRGRLVEGGPVIHRLTAERDLLPWHDEHAGSGLLALGGPDFDRAEGDAPLLAAATSRAPDAVERVRFSPLPQTGAEVNEIAALWRASSVRDAAEVLEHVGTAATEAAFEREAPGRRVLHVATHGFALGDTSATAARPGARGVGAVTSGRTAAAPRAAPLLPGLALAGANATPVAGGEDGFLTAEEITSLDLGGVEWAVLSACETGRSDPAGAEAVQGLQRAFRRAGARTVVMSLWAVDDASTREWMRRLYDARLRRGLDTAAAVAAACRETLRDRRARGLDTHPFHWAAFVAAGDWR